MGRPRIRLRDATFWNTVRVLLDEARVTGLQNWTELASSLGVSKQTLTGFRKGRIPSLDAEAVFRLFSKYNLFLAFEGRTIGCTKPEVSQVTVEFDNSFRFVATPRPAVILTRKPPGQISFIGVRFDQVLGGVKE